MASEEFVTLFYIKRHKIVFRPDVVLKKEVAKDFKLKRVSSEAME